MKPLKFYFYLSFILFPTLLFAQGSATDSLTNGCIFPEFSDGFVLNKDGGRIAAKLNYYCIAQKMLFKDAKGQIMEFGVPEDVILVTIGDRCFVNSGKGFFYEQVPVGDTYYYIQWQAKVISTGKGSGYGSYSSTTAITNISGIGNSGDYTQLKADEKILTQSECIYYLKVKNAYKKINSIKTLTKLFKGHETDIERFADEQKIDFNNSSDIAKIAEFCYTFSK